MTTSVPPAVTPCPSARREIETLSGQKVALCYQCQKCTSGCPVSFAMDVPPHRLMHLLRLGLVEEALRSKTIWICASCETCTTRCPNGIDIALVMDTLRNLSRRKGIRTSPESLLFNNDFLTSVRNHGRVHELRMITEYTLKSQGLIAFLKQAGLGMSLLIKGKLKLLPPSLRPNPDVKAIFERVRRKERG